MLKKVLKLIKIAVISIVVIFGLLVVYELMFEEDDYNEDQFSEMFYEKYGYYPEEQDYENYDESDYYDDSKPAAVTSNGPTTVDHGSKENDYYYYDEEYYAAPKVDESKLTNNQDSKGPEADWTVLVYMTGSDLESQNACGVTDIREMLSAKHGTNVNVILETGGAKKWNGYNISAKSLQRWKVEGGKLTKVGEAKLDSMGKASTLSDFITWGVSKYPAKKYILEFWNHGSGSISGVCFDELFEDDSLYVYEMKEALETANTRFEAVLFDTCLSATIEVADVLSAYANYQVASEEVLYGGCFGYGKWITSLSSHPEWTGADLGRMIGPIYKNAMTEIELESQYTMAAIDLSKISDVKRAFSAMASGMNLATQNVSSFKNLSKMGAKVQKYGSSSPLEGYTNLVDLSDLAAQASVEVPKEAAALQQAIKNCIVWEGHGSDKAKSSGLAVYYPIKYDNEGDDYAKTTNNKEYLRYLDTIIDEWTAPAWVNESPRARKINPVKKTSYKVEYNTCIIDEDDDAFFAINFTSGKDIIRNVNMALFMYDEDEKSTYYLGADNNVQYNKDGSTYYDDFEATWITLDDYFVTAEIIEQNDEFNIYSIPVELNKKDSNLRVRYTHKNGKFEVIGAFDGIENGASSKGIRKLKNGDKIHLLYPVYDETTDEELTIVSEEEIVWTGNNVIDDGELPAGTYYLQYVVTDMFGKVYETDLLEVEYDGDSITYYDAEE